MQGVVGEFMVCLRNKRSCHNAMVVAASLYRKCAYGLFVDRFRILVVEQSLDFGLLLCGGSLVELLHNLS